jgi:hypothetical protein
LPQNIDKMKNIDQIEETVSLFFPRIHVFLSCLDLAICCVCTFLTDADFPLSSLLRLERLPSGRLSLQCLDTLSMQETFGQD